MICSNPYNGPAGLYPCGQCHPCRFNQRRVWTHRLLLEATQHAYSAFVTLTYDDKHLPADGSLDPLATRYWLDRLRKRTGYGQIRFYLCGEYGPSTLRPHYHVALFGFPPCLHGSTRSDVRGNPLANCCPPCALVHETWGKGNTFVGGLTENSAQYVSGYVTKKLAGKNDPMHALLEGKHPEFSRQSNRPGIGANAADDIASDMMKFNLDQTQADVPSALRHGSRMLPLGRYMKGKIREKIGRLPTAPKSVQLKNSEKMRPLLEASKFTSDGVKKLYQEVTKGEVNSFEARQKLFKQRKDQI